MNSRIITSLASALLIVACAVICGCIAPDDQSATINTTVPIEQGWNQAAVALLELYALGEAGQEPYERFNGSVVSPDPLILFDSDGNPLYYRFFVRKNGETVYAVQLSANKLLGTTVTDIGDFGSIGSDESADSVNGGISHGAASGGANGTFGTPVPPQGEEYVQMMLDCWGVGDAYAQDVVSDAKNAGIDLSAPLSGDDRDVIREILWENIRQREERRRTIEEKYQVDL